jgi:hypothetical protein
MMDMTVQEILTALFEALARFGLDMAGIPYPDDEISP